MRGSPDTSEAFNFSAMSYGDKLSLTLELIKSYGLVIFLVLLVGFILLVAVSLLIGLALNFGGDRLLVSFLEASSTNGRTIGAFLLFTLIRMSVMLLSGFFYVGVFSLVLRYIDGLPPEEGVVSQVLNPWHNFWQVFLGLLVWLLIYSAAVVILSALGQLPLLGLPLGIARLILFCGLSGCVLLYMADAEGPSLGQALSTPLLILRDNFGRWVGAALTALALYVPAVFFLTFLMASAAGSLVINICLLLFFAVYFTVALIFILFFFGLTFRQGYAESMGDIAERIF